MNQEVLASKKQVVEEIENKIKNAGSMVVVEYRGLTVAEVLELRRALRAENSYMEVYKNTLVTKAAENLGYTDLLASLTGPNACIFAQDEISAAKVCAKFAKKHEKLVIKAGIVENKVVGLNDVMALSALPNKEGMLSMLLGCLTQPLGNYARVIKAVADQKEAN